MDHRVRALVIAACIACTRAEPPAWDAAPGTLSAAPLPASSAPLAASASPDAGDAGPGPDAGDPATLPQTHDKPSATGAGFDARVHALWDGIVKDDPTAAMPFFFPLAAYVQVKAVGNPAGDWRQRLVANFARDVHKLHERLGSHAQDARFLGIDVPSEHARWVEPGEEYNKLGYYRVFGTKLRYAVGDRPGTVDISSLIAWRGEWYVVHLSGFK